MLPTTMKPLLIQKRSSSHNILLGRYRSSQAGLSVATNFLEELNALIAVGGLAGGHGTLHLLHIRRMFGNVLIGKGAGMDYLNVDQNTYTKARLLR